MAQELIYTSAERGLRLGVAGYCTVAHTSGMTAKNIQLLEALSTYTSAYSVQEESEGLESPVCWSHTRGALLGPSATVLSRISPTSADHTNRSNKIAHHFLVRSQDRPVGGPGWLCAQPELFVDHWQGEPRLLPEERTLPQGDESELGCETWGRVTGEEANAWVLASSFQADPNRVTVLVFTPGLPMLDLIRESLALLPPQLRWQVTFSTYFTALSAGTTCAWRCCLAGSDVLRQQQRNPRVTVLDVTRPLPPVSAAVKAGLERARQQRSGGASPERPAQRVSGTPFKLMHDRINQVTLRPRH